MFSDEHSGDATGIWSSLSMARPHQLHADAFASATALRDSLADDLLKWQLMETRLRRASQEVPQYCRMVFTKCEGLVTRFDNLSAHELDRTHDLQAFIAKFASLKRDMAGVLAMMSDKCDNAPSAAQQTLIPSPHISTLSTDPPLPTPPATHCDEFSHTVIAAVTTSDLHNVAPPISAPNHAPQNHGSNDGAASHITAVSSVD
jgi:hypothetical protein